MQQEKEYLRSAFGSDYAQYEAGVPLFFPRLTPSEHSQGQFSFHQYLANKEYKALLGYFGALVVAPFENEIYPD